MSIRLNLSVEKLESLRKPDIFLYPALPNDQYTPTGTSEFSQGARVALLIGSNFSDPKIDITFGDGSSARAGVTMPEATVYEDNPSLAGKYEIWRSRQAFHMQPVAIAEPMKSRPYRHFRLRISAFNTRHQAATLFDCQSIHLDKCSSVTR